MSTQIKTVWYRMVERVKALPGCFRERLGPDLGKNDSVLANVSESDPTLRALQDHAFAQFDNELTSALDVGKPAALRLSHLDRAAGVAAYLTNVENVRDRAKVQMAMELRQREAANSRLRAKG